MGSIEQLIASEPTTRVELLKEIDDILHDLSLLRTHVKTETLTSIRLHLVRALCVMNSDIDKWCDEYMAERDREAEEADTWLAAQAHQNDEPQ